MVASLELARAALVKGGVLRAGVNLSNFLLVSSRGPNDEPRGVSPSLCLELANRLDAELEIVPYANPGLLADGAAKGEWAVGLIGAEPARAATIAFTRPYAEIEATYAVPPGSSYGDVAAVDAAGCTVAVSRRSAYGLWLEANLEKASLKQTADPGLAASADLFFDARADALAGLRPWLLGLRADDDRFREFRVLDGRFATVNQAIGTPRLGREDDALPFLAAFVDDVTSSGLVADLIRDTGVEGKLSVAAAKN